MVVSEVFYNNDNIAKLFPGMTKNVLQVHKDGDVMHDLKPPQVTLSYCSG